MQKSSKNKNKKQEYKKAKETNDEKRISPENWLKKIRPPGWRYFSSPAFPETRFFFWPNEFFPLYCLFDLRN